jgi:hypothetical protein
MRSRARDVSTMEEISARNLRFGARSEMDAEVLSVDRHKDREGADCDESNDDACEQMEHAQEHGCAWA